MCKYCEKRDTKHVDEIPNTVNEGFASETSFERVHATCCVIKPTPISKRQHELDGLTSELKIMVEDGDKVYTIAIPVKYCPICGREID